jgi:hypothetical protein
VDDGVSFQLFRNEFYLTWKILSHHLSFSARLPISLEQACHGFNRHDFWGLILGQVVHGSLHLGAMNSKPNFSFDAQMVGHQSLSK